MVALQSQTIDIVLIQTSALSILSGKRRADNTPPDNKEHRKLIARLQQSKMGSEHYEESLLALN